MRFPLLDKRDKSAKDIEFFMYQFKTRACTVVSGAAVTHKLMAQLLCHPAKPPIWAFRVWGAHVALQLDDVLSSSSNSSSSRSSCDPGGLWTCCDLCVWGRPRSPTARTSCAAQSAVLLSSCSGCSRPKSACSATSSRATNKYPALLSAGTPLCRVRIGLVLLQKRPHEWKNCCYVHENEKARRRDPRVYDYAADPCPVWMEVRETRRDARGWTIAARGGQPAQHAQIGRRQTGHAHLQAIACAASCAAPDVLPQDTVSTVQACCCCLVACRKGRVPRVMRVVWRMG